MKRAFTLIELLVVISVIGLISSTVFTQLTGAISNAAGSNTAQIKRELTKAAQLYELDMGFFPPDVGRGWDPGFERSAPWNPDVEEGTHSGSTNVRCDHCPSNWESIVNQRWNGPYFTWPRRTPWGGRYDYNIWLTDVNRPGGCRVSAGIYAGAQGDYQNNNTIPQETEEKLTELRIDNDGCVNGESQLLLQIF